MDYNTWMRVEKTDEYLDWLDELKDQTGRARILVRVDRLIEGNPGQYRDLTAGVSELKLDFGPAGYRVYYTLRGQRLLLLLLGGDKSTQQKDIETAVRLAKNFKE